MPQQQVHGRRTARANFMVGIGSALYFLILLLALYVMDRQVYTNQKTEIIRSNFLEIFSLPDYINDQARRALYSNPASRRTEALEKLGQTLQQIVDGPSSIYRMWLADEHGNIVTEVTNPTKPARLNTFENNLFIREFSGRTTQNVTPTRTILDGPSPTVGHLVGVYTSPVNVPAITALTKKYRVYAALLIIVWILAWLIIYYYLLRPVRNVTVHLDRLGGNIPTLIRPARGALEGGYNDLAASALLQSLEETLNTAARLSNQPGSRGEAIRTALAMAGDGFGAEWLRVAITGVGDAAMEQYEWKKGGPDVTPAATSTSVPEVSCPADPQAVTFQAYADQSGFTWHAPLASGCIQVDCRYSGGRSPGAQFQTYLVRACESLRAGFVAFQAYREQLFRERSEANISLSRNMGHDLTNIIATSKLELMGVRRILAGVSRGEAITEQRASILSQSVNGLLESTRFMQEMVNIYRSFSYVKRPAYERRALVPLLEEFIQMFEPALSSHVRISRNLPPDLPSPIVEPRLLKLAVFNVLQNALDAVKRNDDDLGPGRLTLSLSYKPESRIYEIAVTDNGPGIRDESGHLLTPEQVTAIFDYGYTTKGTGGEGLGLNWVQTIMTDFHDGGVRAENNSGGGATITLFLQSMERKEARVGQDG